MSRAFGGIAVAVATAGMLVAGGGAAAADDPEPGPPPITLTAEQTARVCDEAIPRLLERIAGARERAAADVGTPGSTAWLEQRVRQARDAGRTAQADRLQQRLDRRPQLAERLAGAERRITAFRDDRCG
ncbi:hypothetical protein [Pseudonocardia humida]|uniref:Hemophore-related protein n=1 Tax=Pseudonocardia humida TaxID=2800819 RepID=A0ABT1ABW2_9PSEU|nr:hypothetical protein [Pseudonocardia humida]MCO1660139.1 hypothetical protein [Pseudonocardia humida]